MNALRGAVARAGAAGHKPAAPGGGRELTVQELLELGLLGCERLGAVGVVQGHPVRFAVIAAHLEGGELVLVLERRTMGGTRWS